MPKFQIPEKLLPFLNTKKRFKIAYGGRGGGKSETFAATFAMKAHAEKALVACFREYQNSIDDSVYSLIRSCIQKYDFPGFDINKSTITHKDGGGFRFKGLARSIEGIKSMHGTRYFWVEEGQFLSEESLRILTPTLREKDSELWISANPMSSADPFSQRFIVPFQAQLDNKGYHEDDLHLIIKVNYNDNPWFPKVLEDERRFDFVHLPRAMYDHVWEGSFNDHVEYSIILAEWFDACVDAHTKLGFKPEGAVVVSFDPSDLGTDDKALVKRQGSVILDAKLKKVGDVNEGCEWAAGYANYHGVDTFIWDADGMGVSLRKQVQDAFKGKKVDMQPFRGSSAPLHPGRVYQDIRLGSDSRRTNRDTFKNRRAQYYWILRDRMFQTYLAVEKGQYVDPEKMLSISSDIKLLPQLRSEICRVPRKPLGSGMIQILSKVEMKKLKIQSPNLSDATMMSLLEPNAYIGSTEPMVFDSFY